MNNEKRYALFVKEFIKDFNATQAAVRAGYSEKTAGQQGHRLLRNAKIQEDLAKAIRERAERAQVDSDYVLQRLCEIDRMDCADILNDDGSIKSILQWPKIWRQMINGLDITEMKTEAGAIAAVKKIKWPDKIRNLELIGKHVDVSAFENKVENNSSNELIDAFNEIVNKLGG